MTTLELTLVASSAGLLLAYHIYFFHQLRHAPEETTQGRAREYRSAWARAVMERNDGILAVQTLRNWSMSASFLASTAIIISAGVFGFMFSADKTSVLVHEFNFLGSPDPRLLSLKLILIATNFLATFFSFSLCLRYYNYAALTVNTPLDTGGDEMVQATIDHLERAAHHFAFGMRCYHLAIPLTLWIFGPIWLMAASIGLTFALYRHDHVV